MSLTAVLSNALSGMAVAQHALGVTSSNVANVNTEGYTRKLAQQAAVIVAGRGAGAQALDTTRAVDEYLGSRIREQQAVLGRSEVLGRFQSQIQDRLFGAPGDVDRGLATVIGRIATAAEALAGGPGEVGLATAFLGSVEDLGNRLASAGNEIDDLRRSADQQIAGTLGEINADLRALAEVNGQIKAGRAGADLLDRRDQLLESLATRIEISVHVQDDGTTTIYTRAGQPLLDGAARQLVYEPAASIGQDTVFGPIRLYRADQLDGTTGEPLSGAVGAIVVTGGVRAELTPELAADGTPDGAQRIVSPFRSGSLQGLLEARDRVLPELADQLGELAGLTRFVLDAAHNATMPYPPPGQLVGTRTDTAAFASAARSGTAYLAVIDRNTGDTVTTFAVDVGGAADAASLAAQIATDLGGLGTAGLQADGTLAIAAASGFALALSEGDSSITGLDAAGHARDYAFAHYFGLNDLLVGGGSTPMQLALRPDLAADSSGLSRSQLDVDPGPPPNSRLGGAGDQRGAQRLAAAFETGVGTIARGGLPAGNHRPGDYAAEIVSLSAVTSARAQRSEANDRALADDLGARRAEVSGVNLDEEMSKLILYQEAYSVSARLVAITSDLFDELLAMVGGR